MTNNDYNYDPDKYCDWNQIPFVVFKENDGHRTLVNLDYENPFLKLMHDSCKERKRQGSVKVNNETEDDSIEYDSS